jgi:hypothetical protein
LNGTDAGSADYALSIEAMAETKAYLDDISSAIKNNNLKDAFSTDLATWTLAFMTNPA